ncbi:WD40 repeat-like protein [Leucogyrophana mollusca]|uniref:WD40 repeat-like protein n=1 Tax=Leucogyrophana mollusca TaxID=85980 RepID=A0ACB8BE22_9AGAM|nr:WD40 repeat-like protein [Leucogyrophana mollusca]
MQHIEFDIDMADNDFDDDSYDGPDAYVDGDDNVLELEEHIADEEESRGQLQAEGPSLAQILRYLARIIGGGNSTNADEDDDEELVEDEDEGRYYGRSSWSEQWFSPHKEPQQAGVELLNGGEFGAVSTKIKTRKNNRNLTRLLLDRSTRSRNTLRREGIASHILPNSSGTAVASYGANIYCGQFSADSSFYYTCCQDFRLHVYDMTAPPTSYIKRNRASRRSATGHWDHDDRDHETTMKVIKTIQGNPGRWTITDSHLSPDNERMIYSSISPTVYMTNTLDSSSVQIPIRFADPPRRQSRMWGYYDEDSFGIWSCRFSADGNEVVAGGSGQIFVYDLLSDRRTVKISAHDDDVNSCCWADTASGNVLISASDDTFLKVWDRRSLGASQKPSGVLVGHTEGITNVSAKGDGRYIISNGKDQALRLWDLRKMCSSEDFDNGANRDFRSHSYDYRYGHYPKPRRSAHPNDCSVMTYRGHAVLRTLIRCHFSPAETTGGQYIYSGSADGRIHIWSLDGRIVQVLDRSHTLPMSYDPSGPEMKPLEGARNSVCVRDVSWNSTEPVMMSAGWEGSRTGGSIVARHEWKGLSKMASSLEDWTEKQKAERAERAAKRASRNRRLPGAFEDESDEE